MLRCARVLLLGLAAAAAAFVTGSIEAQSPVRVVKVVGDRHQLALRSDGSVIGWGTWGYGQLGPVSAIGVTTPWTDRPVAMDLPGKAVDVAAGDITSYALLDDGTLWAWGDGRQGELGTGANPNLPRLSNSTPSMEYRGAERPVKVGIDQVAAIAAAGHTAVAILKDGTVSQWPRRRTAGSDPSFRPMAVPTLANVTQVSVGWSHVLARTADGMVWAWGSNAYGALGIEPKSEQPVLDPVPVPGVSNVAAVAAASDVSLVLKRDGTVWVWGSNGQAQFGNGQRTSHPSVGTTTVPQPVPGVTTAVAISAGTGRQVLVVLEDGTLRGWGNTDFGQIGAGVSGVPQPSVTTPKISGVRAVFAVGNNSYAVKTDGSFWGWGYGANGRWPFAAVTKLPAPVALP